MWKVARPRGAPSRPIARQAGNARAGPTNGARKHISGALALALEVAARAGRPIGSRLGGSARARLADAAARGTATFAPSRAGPPPAAPLGRPHMERCIAAPKAITRSRASGPSKLLKSGPSGGRCVRPIQAHRPDELTRRSSRGPPCGLTGPSLHLADHRKRPGCVASPADPISGRAWRWRNRARPPARTATTRARDLCAKFNILLELFREWARPTAAVAESCGPSSIGADGRADGRAWRPSSGQ